MLNLDPLHEVPLSVVQVAPALVDFMAFSVVAYTMFPFAGSNSTSKVESFHKGAHDAPALIVR